MYVNGCCRNVKAGANSTLHTKLGKDINLIILKFPSEHRHP